ncbi:hypothetical protein N7492_007887 [Penicillium capsulatum]|uniref:ABC transporter domain-containing protein n=1 Tax=Penicillium capsulatum TaxID=69766 RepID=A0A9W9I4V9_9EURO|nr:hypothetical protein N7492_007887 [Penicillium capsulatum]KAJ6117718.1 hypothetical protein N7512_007443 [Penicillium capsulatum]
MPAPLHSHPHHGSFTAAPDAPEHPPRVQVSHADSDVIGEIHRTLTAHSQPEVPRYDEPHSSFDKFLDEQVQEGRKRSNLGVCFQSLSIWGAKNEHVPVKTLKEALWRTLTCQDIYEWTIQPWRSPQKPQEGRPLILEFSGTVPSGQMMLVLGRPGAGCSTFLRSIAGHHSSFLGVTGAIDYSGLSPEEIQKHYRSAVTYTPEEDVHFPTLTVRQTLEFALPSKTPKRLRHMIPRYLEIYGRVFGMTHVMDTLVGNEYIRGVSGGERKRISIIESLATDSSVNCWDNSTRGLDASSALDYARSLRIMTDKCGKATLLTLYQASDAIYDLMDKVLLIDDGRMLFQGPAHEAKRYFEDLGYECAHMQTTADFLTSITVPERRKFRPGWKDRAPKGPIELEAAFRQSEAFKAIEVSIAQYEERRNHGTDSECGSLDDIKRTIQGDKSRFVSPKSSYTISLFRQVILCAQRQLWQLKGHMAPLYIKLISAVVYGLLVGSMFYNQPQTTDGMYSRGGVLFYSSILLAWLQMSELEAGMEGRDILNRHKHFAFVRPTAVGMARFLQDIMVSASITVLYLIVLYFLSGLRLEAGPFFIDCLFIFTCTVCLTSQFRVFAALSTNFEVALRYSGVSVLFCVVFGGYVLSVDKMIQDVPWVGWIAYTTPAFYTYESVLAAEFHNLNFTCAPGSVAPSGPGYTDLAFQTCVYPGSKPGTTIVNGDDYLATQFGFSYSHVWRNFGILCLFTIAFIAITCWLSEVFEFAADGAGPIQYKDLRQLTRETDEEETAVPVDHRAPPMGAAQAKPEHSLLGTSSTFTWQDLNLNVQIGKETRTLLDGVDGYCKPGTLTALVGASGAGKSTLLTALTQRQSAGHLSGSICVDNHPIDETFNRQIGYCQQMDIHDESSTVREAFEFSALLRQSSDIPRVEKLAYVDTVLHTLDLGELHNAIIGSLDIEKKKRVTIGVELCARPRLLLFLDEPTSGLDSQGATSIVTLLRRLANHGLAVLCTIHQANQQQFEQFDRVLALSPGGGTYYFGEVGHLGQAIFDYFSRHGHEAKNVTNAADFLIEVVVGGMKASREQVNWASIWRESPEAAEVKREIATMREKSSGVLAAPLSPPLSQQIYLLTQRTSRQYWRTAEYPYSRLYSSFLHALFNGLTYLQIGNSTTDLQSKAFSCFLVLMLVPEIINAVSFRFIINREIWMARERPSGVYGSIAFSTAQILSEIPYSVIGSVVFFVLYYFMVGLPIGFAAGYSFLMFLLFFLFATAWGQWIAALSSDSTVAATLMPFFIIMCELFSGVLQHKAEMPVFWQYTMYYVTPFTYWIGGVLSAVLSGTPVICNDDELTWFESPSNMTCEEYARPWLASQTGYLSNAESTKLCGYCQFSQGDDYLSGIGLNGSKAWPYFGIFLAFTVTNYLMVYLLVSVRAKSFWRST